MAFQLNINNILRQDVSEALEVGKVYEFHKDGLFILADTMPIWLTRKDWTALAEIYVMSQQREDGATIGTFKVIKLYSETESGILTEVFRRMFEA